MTKANIAAGVGRLLMPHIERPTCCWAALALPDRIFAIDYRAGCGVLRVDNYLAGSWASFPLLSE